MQADTLIADKAFDADERVPEPLADAGKTAVIPPRTNRSLPRDYDRELYAQGCSTLYTTEPDRLSFRGNTLRKSCQQSRVADSGAADS